MQMSEPEPIVRSEYIDQRRYFSRYGKPQFQKSMPATGTCKKATTLTKKTFYNCLQSI